MHSLPAIPEAFLPRFEQMWKSACYVCDNIRDYQPEMILALMQSGWGPVYAAQTLWQQTQSQPFPPVARSSIGRGKIDIFGETFNLVDIDFFVGQYSSDLNVGRLLAWAASRSDWHAQLRQQVAEVMQSMGEPRRILVVDDCIHEGSTAILTLGILRKVYPQADVRFLDARGWYRSDYRAFMLAALIPAGELFPEGKIPTQEVNMHLGWAAVGSENDCEESLCWRPISVDSPDVQALAIYRPASEWVEASQAIYAILAQYIRERAVAYVPAQPDNRFSFDLWANWLAMGDAWMENGITRRQMEQRYGYSSQAAQSMLEKWMEWNYLEPQGVGRGRRYVIPTALQRWVNKLDDIQEGVREAYWLLPERLMFGERLWFAANAEGNESLHKEVSELLELGVDCWLDVQIIQKGKSPKEYPSFEKECRACGREASMQPIVITAQYVDKGGLIRVRRGRPSRKDYRLILDQIDRRLAEGRVVYVSADGSNLRGILAGCYLARHGQTGETALNVLHERRATGVNGWKREPSLPKARQYVREWQEGW